MNCACDAFLNRVLFEISSIIPIIFLLTTVRSFLTSSTARSSLSVARFSQSSTVIRTWSSSFKCSQFGLPRFCSS